MPLPESTFEIVLAHRVCLESSGDIARGMIECASLEFAVHALSNRDNGPALSVSAVASETRKALYRLAGGLKALQATVGNNVLCELKADSYCLQNPIKATFETQPQGLLRAYLHFLSALDQGMLLMDAAVTGGLVDRRRRNRFVKRSSSFLFSALRRIHCAHADVLNLVQCSLDTPENCLPVTSEALGIQFDRLPGLAVVKL